MKKWFNFIVFGLMLYLVLIAMGRVYMISGVMQLIISILLWTYFWESWFHNNPKSKVKRLERQRDLNNKIWVGLYTDLMIATSLLNDKQKDLYNAEMKRLNKIEIEKVGE